MKGTDPTIRPLRLADRDDALAVINVAAQWYREFLPEEEWHEPEMTPAQWEAEAQRMTWNGAFVGGNLVGTMGLEYVQDAVLLRLCRRSLTYSSAAPSPVPPTSRLSQDPAVWSTSCRCREIRFLGTDRWLFDYQPGH